MKKIINLLAAALAMVMMMSACSAVGTPTSLVGIWKLDDNQGGSGYMQITDDDHFKTSSTKEALDSLTGFEIVKCTCNEIHIKSDNGPTQIMQYELSGNSLTLIRGGSTAYTYTKD